MCHRRSAGLRTPSAPRSMTCKYTIVVLTSACPSTPGPCGCRSRLQVSASRMMTKTVRADVLRQARLSHRLLDDRLVQVIPRRWTPLRVAADSRRGKHKPPRPVRRRLRILAIEREQQDDASHAVGQIALMLSLDLAQVCLQPLPDRRGEHRAAVFLFLTSSHDDLVRSKSRSFTRRSRQSWILSPAP